MYYIVSIAKRKNAKKHIIEKVENFKDVLPRLHHWCDLNDNYIYEAYNGKWEHVYTLAYINRKDK